MNDQSNEKPVEYLSQEKERLLLFDDFILNYESSINRQEKWRC